MLALGRDFKLLAQNDLGETVMATPAVSDGVLYIRGRKHLFASGSTDKPGAYPTVRRLQ